MSSVFPLSGKESDDFERDHCLSRTALMQEILGKVLDVLLRI
jgi:hypothetical protein